MAHINRSLITKVAFSVLVVAATATAGFAGFAGAARQTLAQANGYGYDGNGAAIQAAIAEFQRALGLATDEFNSDIDACIAAFTPRDDDDDESEDFDRSSDSAVGDFSSRTADPTAFNNTNKLNAHIVSETKNLNGDLDSATSQLTTQVDRQMSSQSDRQDFRACVKDARKDYTRAINQARRNLIKAIRDITRP